MCEHLLRQSKTFDAYVYNRLKSPFREFRVGGHVFGKLNANHFPTTSIFAILKPNGVCSGRRTREEIKDDVIP